MILPSLGIKKFAEFSFLPEPSHKQFLKLPVQNFSREQWYYQVLHEKKMIVYYEKGHCYKGIEIVLLCTSQLLRTKQ